MSDKSRLCNVCGQWIPLSEDLVLMAYDMGAAHVKCAASSEEAGDKDE